MKKNDDWTNKMMDHTVGRVLPDNNRFFLQSSSFLPSQPTKKRFFHKKRVLTG